MRLTFKLFLSLSNPKFVVGGFFHSNGNKDLKFKVVSIMRRNTLECGIVNTPEDEEMTFIWQRSGELL